MKHTLDIVDALKAEICLLERAYEPPGDNSSGATPGSAHIRRINTLIADLIREIEINAPNT